MNNAAWDYALIAIQEALIGAPAQSATFVTSP